jgi:hypothetical protein
MLIVTANKFITQILTITSHMLGKWTSYLIPGKRLSGFTITNAPLTSNRSSNSGMAVISLDLASVAT